MFAIHCADSYVPSRARSGDHAPLELSFTLRQGRATGWTWRRFVQRFDTLDAAKAFAQTYYEANREKFLNTPS